MPETSSGAQTPHSEDEILITSEEALALFEADWRASCGMSEDDPLDPSIYPLTLQAFKEEVAQDLDSPDPAVRAAAIDLARYTLWGIEDK